MQNYIYRIALLVTMLFYTINVSLSNDTLNAVLITEGERSLTLEKLLQFKCTDTWKPNIGELVFDELGNIYTTIHYGDKLELPDNSIKKNQNIYVLAVMKFSPSYELLWYKELYGNNKIKDNIELDIYKKSLLFEKNSNTLKLNIYAITSDISTYDTIYYDNKIIDTLEILADNINGAIGLEYTERLLSIDAETGNFLNFISLGLKDENRKIIQHNEREIYYTSTFNSQFCGINKKLQTSINSQGENDWYFAKLDTEQNLIWEYSVGGSRNDYIGEWSYEPTSNMYIFGDTMYITYPFQSDSIQINPDKNNPIYVYSTSYEFGMSGLGLVNEDAVIERLLIKNDQLKLLDYKKVSWDSLPQNIRKDKNGKTLIYIYCKDSLEYGFSTLKHYELLPDLSMKNIDPYEGKNSIYMHGFDNSWFGHLDYDNNYNYIENRYLYNEDWIFNFSDSIKNIQYTNKATGNIFIKYNSQKNFCYAYIMPIFVYAEIQSDANTGRLFVSGEGDYHYNVDRSSLNWNPWEKNQIVSSREKDGGLKSCFLAVYRETFKVKGEAVGKGHVITPDSLIWFGKDCEVQVVPDKGFQIDSVVTDRGETLEANDEGKYIVKEVKDVTTVKAYFSAGSAVEENLANGIYITPNPSSDFIEIISDKNVRYEILDVKSAIIKTGNEKHVNIKSLPKGVYVIRLFDGKELVKTEKIIKE